MIGNIINQNSRKHKFYLSHEDLEKHMFICGSTGTGKSNFVQNFLINFKKQYSIPFLLIEFKGEYVFLKKYIKDLIILKPGENFSINIFNPEGTDPDIHAERVFDILKSGQFLEESAEFSPQMQKVIVDILKGICRHNKYQDWYWFFKLAEKYRDKFQDKIPMLSQTIISIKNRIRRFSAGPLKAVFSDKYKLNVKELFRQNVIIDLSSIIRLGGQKEDALFFLNMILKYLWDENLTKGSFNYNGIQHLTIVEDAQYFAPKDLTKQTKLSNYLEDIALLQRGTGECLISIATRPQVSEEILANCGVLVIFKNHMEKELQSKLLNLNENLQYYFSLLQKGHSLIRTNSIKRPFLLSIPYIDRKPEVYIDKRINKNKLEANSSLSKEIKFNSLSEKQKQPLNKRINNNNSSKNKELSEDSSVLVTTEENILNEFDGVEKSNLQEILDVTLEHQEELEKFENFINDFILQKDISKNE